MTFSLLQYNKPCQHFVRDSRGIRALLGLLTVPPPVGPIYTNWNQSIAHWVTLGIGPTGVTWQSYTNDQFANKALPTVLQYGEYPRQFFFFIFNIIQNCYSMYLLIGF